MANPKIEVWEKEFRLKYVPDCGNDEVCRAFYDSMIDLIRQLLQSQHLEIAEKVKKLSKEETNICVDAMRVGMEWNQALEEVLKLLTK